MNDQTIAQISGIAGRAIAKGHSVDTALRLADSLFSIVPVDPGPCAPQLVNQPTSAVSYAPPTPQAFLGAVAAEAPAKG